MTTFNYVRLDASAHRELLAGHLYDMVAAGKTRLERERHYRLVLPLTQNLVTVCHKLREARQKKGARARPSADGNVVATRQMIGARVQPRCSAQILLPNGSRR